MLRVMRDCALSLSSVVFSFLIGHQFLAVLLPHKAQACPNTAVDDLGGIRVMCGITTSNDFCELIVSVIIVPWVHPHAKRFIGVVWSMDVIECITPRWINDRTGGEVTRLEDMASAIRAFGFEHVASELFWLTRIFCHCLFSLFGGINGIISIASIGDKRLINVDVLPLPMQFYCIGDGE